LPAEVNDESTAQSAIDILKNDQGLLDDVMAELTPDEQNQLRQLLGQ